MKIRVYTTFLTICKFFIAINGLFGIFINFEIVPPKYFGYFVWTSILSSLLVLVIIIITGLRKQYSGLKKEMNDFLNFMVDNLFDTEDAKNIRAVIFLQKNQRCNEIKIAFVSKIRSEEIDMDIEFKIFQGCAGQAWGKKKYNVGNLEIVNHQEIKDKWNLTDTQISVTKKLKSIIAYPVQDPFNKSKFIGALVLDSEKNYTDIFETNEFREKLANNAGAITKKLKEYCLRRISFFHDIV